MTHTLRPYPTYRRTDLPWLTSLPDRWQLVRNKHIWREVNARSAAGAEELLTVSQYTGVTRRRDSLSADGALLTNAESLAGHKRVARNDLVVNIMLAWNGSLGVSDHEGIVSPAYAVFRVKTAAEPYYFHYLYRSPVFTGLFKTVSTGVVDSRLRLYPEVFFRLLSPVPPPAEQAVIVRFLDYTDRHIRRYIAAKRKLITVLNEQKRGAIEAAVTRGLDRTSRLKPSGIPWLEEVPAHWEVQPFVRCAIERADYRGATPLKVESGVFLVTAKNIRRGYIDYETSKEFVAKDDYAKIMRRGLPQIGDLLLTTEAPLGHAALVDREDVALAQRVIRFRMNPRKILPRFALLSVLSPYFQNQLLSRATGSTASGIKASKLPQLEILCPPLDEQRQILEWMDSECGPTDLAIARTTREIELVREYRTRLIADAVTGKGDVREAAAALPEVETDMAAESDVLAEADAELVEDPVEVAEETEA